MPVATTNTYNGQSRKDSKKQQRTKTIQPRGFDTHRLWFKRIVEKVHEKYHNYPEQKGIPIIVQKAYPQAGHVIFIFKYVENTPGSSF